MKKILPIILSVFMLVSCFAIFASAAEAPAWTTAEPALVISEIVPDCTNKGGTSIGGWTDGSDVFEAFEIYNNSNVAQNLYEYCLVYNDKKVSESLFEKCIVEITPFLTNNVWENKPGNYLDGSDFVKNWTATDYEVGDLSNLPTNPETCIIQPGECIVVWSMAYEPYFKKWNEGKGMSIDDFRTFWNIPESVQVIAWDGCSNVEHGGNNKNFNIRNSKVSSYGIAKYSDMLNSAANTASSVYDAKTFREFEDLISWSILNFETYNISSKANTSYVYTIDADGSGAAQLTTDTGKAHLYDKRRMIMLESQVATPTLGSLSDLQKMTFTNYTFKAGEKIVLPTAKACKGLAYDLFVKDGNAPTGFFVNSKIYAPGETFTAEAAGKYTFIPVYAADTQPPTNVRWDGNVLNWDAVSGATKYVLSVLKDGTACGADLETVTNSHDFTDFFNTNKDGKYSVSVVAFIDEAQSIASPSPDKAVHIHNWATSYTKDETGHWYVCSGCSEKKDYAAHNWSMDYINDEIGHWYACTVCSEKKDYAVHDYSVFSRADASLHWRKCPCGREQAEGSGHHGGTANCIDKKICDYCKEPYGTTDSTVHKTPEVFEYEANNNGTHKVKYDCCKAVKASAENCSGGTADCDNKAICQHCNTAYGDTAHDYSELSVVDSAYHIMRCSICKLEDSATPHSGGTATCTEAAICTVCNLYYGTTLAHSFTVCRYDESQHWYKCANCDEIGTKYDHDFGGDNVCDTCEYNKSHVHGNGTIHNGTDANCATKTNGEATYYVCSCNAKFYDAACTQAVVNDSELVIPYAHTYVAIPKVYPTCTDTGLTEGSRCSVCNEILVAQTVIRAHGHFDTVTHGYPASCSASGLTDGRSCLVCGTVTVAQTVIPALTHTEVIDEAVAPTCTMAGKTEGKHCSVCNAVITEQTEIAALGHSISEKWTSDADNHWHECTVCGEKTDLAAHAEPCEVCGYGKDKVIVGDIDGKEGIDVNDAIYALYAIMLPDQYPMNQIGDYNGDGKFDVEDAIYLLMYTMLPDLYPIAPLSV